MKAKIKQLLKTYKLERDFMIVYGVGFTIATFLLLYLYFSYPRYHLQSSLYKNSTMQYRDDYLVVFKNDVLNKLNSEYKALGPEYLFCLIGKQSGSQILIEELAQERLISQTEDRIFYEKDPPCQIEGSVGSIHSHSIKSNCFPSEDDLFTFGEMKNPDPIINIIQCDYNKFYIIKMPGQREAFDFRAINWSVVE